MAEINLLDCTWNKINCDVTQRVTLYLISDLNQSNRMSLTPSVTWAQRNNLIFLSINVPDVALPEIKVSLLFELFTVPEVLIISLSLSLQVEKDSLYFKGVGGADKKTYELTMKFFKEVGAEKYISCQHELF